MGQNVGCVGCKASEVVSEVHVVAVKRFDSERTYASYPPFTSHAVASKFQKLLQKSIHDPELRVCVESQPVYASLDELPEEFFDVICSGEVSCEM